MLVIKVVGKKVSVRTVSFDQYQILVGRHSECDLVLDDLAVSSRHATVTLLHGGWHFEDLCSTNGSFVNGRRISSSVEISDGDQIRVGDVLLEIVYAGRDVASSSEFPNSDGILAEEDWVVGDMDLDCQTESSPVASSPAEERRWPVDMHSTSAGPTLRGHFDHLTTLLDDVDVTVFAPAQCRPNDSVLVQVFAHLSCQSESVEENAICFDRTSTKRGATALGTKIARGTPLMFEVISRHARIEESTQELIWNGREVSVQFELDAPAQERNVISKVVVSQDSIPIGTIRFTLEVKQSSQNKERKGSVSPSGTARRFSRAFVSYSSSDREEVLKRAQMLKRVGIEVFQDILSIEPGQRWEDEIYDNIDQSDVMFLFWSSSARDSEEVKKEWQYGLLKKNDDYIQPVIIEGPPIVPPPPELAHLHFNDQIVYFINSPS